MGKVKDLITLLRACDPEAEIRFAEYKDGKTLRWYLGRCCNVEHQEEIKNETPDVESVS